MFDTPYTLTSPNTAVSQNGANTMTRTGAAPARGAPEPTETFRPDPVTNVAPKSRDDARGLGRSYLTAARAAEQYCTYADKMKASESYQVAARYFAQAGDRSAAQQAERAGVRASEAADRCQERPAQAGAPPAPGRQGGPPPAPESCADGVAYARQLAATGVKISMMRMRLAGKGCDVTSLPGGDKPPSAGTCLRFELSLGNEGESPAEIRSQLARAQCPVQATR